MPPNGCILTTPPTTSPCALPGYDPTANGPCAIPLSVKKAAFASSYRVAERHAGGERGVEYTLNATKLFWSRSGIMHVAIAWDHKPLLLLATALLPNRTTDSFEREAEPLYDKQRIQIGLRSGNTVLICFRSGVGHFQSVLIALPLTCVLTSRGKDSISFGSTSRQSHLFCWLPEQLARTYCSAALDRRSDLPYGKLHHLQGSEYDLGILWCSRIFIILEIPRVPRNWRSFSVCPVKG